MDNPFANPKHVLSKGNTRVDDVQSISKVTQPLKFNYKHVSGGLKIEVLLHGNSDLCMTWMRV